jgi:hypothetical protein
MVNERLYREYTRYWFGSLRPISLTLAITWPQSELESNYHFGGGSGE